MLQRKAYHLPDGCNNYVALGFTVVADALHAIHLCQLVDNTPLLTFHGWETVTPFWLFALQNIKTNHTHYILQRKKLQQISENSHQ